MDTYIDRQGEKVGLIEPVKYNGDTLKELFKVTVSKCYLYEPNKESEVKGFEYFERYPTKTQILWAIKKHEGNNAHIDKFYQTEEQIPF